MGEYKQNQAKIQKFCLAKSQDETPGTNPTRTIIINSNQILKEGKNSKKTTIRQLKKRKNTSLTK